MFTLANTPKQHDYVATIISIRDQLAVRELDVLRFQFQSPGRSVTSQDIRDHFSYGGIGASNLLYGKLGNKFATALAMNTESDGSPRKRYWKSLSTGDGTGEYFIWVMRPELANALVETGIVEPESDGLAMVPDLDIHASTFSAVEGRRRLITHLLRERSRELVRRKKATVSTPRCEVCGFCFIEFYGEDYCEVHHLTPLAALAADGETTLDDLAIVCANCHRIIHRYSPPLTIAELRTKIDRHRE